MRQRLKDIARKFRNDMGGNVALIFSISAIPIFGLVGGAIDYTNAQREQTKLQAAYDAASLAGARQLRNGDAAVRDAVNRSIQANLPEDLRGQLNIQILDNRSTVRVSSNAALQVRTAFLGVLGINSMNIRANSEATLGAQEVEVVMVLDNTGSMRSDMAALRSAASRLANDVMSMSPQVRMAVVPYAAAVNPGRAALPMSMVDVLGQSRHHAQTIESRLLARTNDGCRFPWENNTGGGGTGGDTSNPNPDNGGGNDRTDLWSPLRSIASAIGGVFGISAAKAAGAEVTPNTIQPYQGRMIRNGAAFLPDGFPNWNDCGLHNPQRISNLDLFARIPNARWKGCVEARPEPFDVTDALPSTGNPDTLFVPYFAIDEADASTGQGQSNNYMPDGPSGGSGQNVSVGPRGWSWSGTWQRNYSIFKYDGVSRARINENGGETWGPNANCPDEILPLTNNASAVQAKIRGLTHWLGGGTISSEGVAWGWRVLSPAPPFTEGRPYGEVPKIMVLMSDGLNALVRNNPNGGLMSDYTAYGYLRAGRFPDERFDRATEYLNSRMALVCENAKREGIIIYSVLFRERDETARRIMRNCSTDGRLYYEAINSSDLDRAFADIASNISKLRIKK